MTKLDASQINFVCVLFLMVRRVDLTNRIFIHSILVSFLIKMYLYLILSCFKDETFNEAFYFLCNNLIIYIPSFFSLTVAQDAQSFLETSSYI